jgi:hypothetical protein
MAESSVHGFSPAGVLLAADVCQGGYRGDVSLRCGAYLLTHPHSVAEWI